MKFKDAISAIWSLDKITAKANRVLGLVKRTCGDLKDIDLGLVKRT